MMMASYCWGAAIRPYSRVSGAFRARLAVADIWNAEKPHNDEISAGQGEAEKSLIGGNFRISHFRRIAL